MTSSCFFSVKTSLKVAAMRLTTGSVFGATRSCSWPDPFGLNRVPPQKKPPPLHGSAGRFGKPPVG